MAKKNTIKLDFEVDGLDDSIEKIEEAENAAADLKNELNSVENTIENLSNSDIIDENAINKAVNGANKLKDAINKADSELNNLTNQSKFGNITTDIDDLSVKIRTLEGSIKIGAGSMQALVGAVGLLGEGENEFFKKLQENTLFIISMGEGAKNIAEGLTALAENQKVAAVAQRIFNAAANANPYILAASAVITVAGIFLTLRDNISSAVPPTEKLNEEIEALRNKDLQTDLENLATRLDNIKKAVYGEEPNTQLKQSVDLIAELRTKIAEAQQEQLFLTQNLATEETKIALAKYKFAENLSDDELNKNIENTQKLIDYKKEKGLDYAVEQQILMGFSAAITERQLQDSIFTMQNQLEEAIKAQNTIYNNSLKTITTSAENTVGYTFNVLDPIVEKQIEIIKNQKLITDGFNLIPQSAEAPIYTTAQIYQRGFGKIREETAQSIGEISSQLINDITTSAAFATNIVTAFSKDEEKRARQIFQINKVANIANAAMNTSVAVTEALKAKNMASRIAGVAFATAAGLAQIATIKRQQFKSTTLTPPPATTNFSAGGTLGGSNNAPAAVLPQGTANQGFELYGQQQAGARQGGFQRAFVVESDITGTQERLANYYNRSEIG